LQCSGSRGSLGMKENMREGTFTLLREFPLWGIGVPRDSLIFKGRLQGSKLHELRSSLYHWKDIGT